LARHGSSDHGQARTIEQASVRGKRRTWMSGVRSRLTGLVCINSGAYQVGSGEMANFREQLFQQFASQGILVSIGEFKSKYEPKKENRFHIDGITYETSPAKLSEGGVEFEISSKIPQDELDDRNDFDTYFEAIKGVLANDDRHPVATDMENIIQDVGGEDAKERDYVRLRYRYSYDEMCDNDAVSAEIANYQNSPDAHPLPEVPNVNTLAGKVVLVCVENFFCQEATTRMERLIEANQQVRENFNNSKALAD
jgi:hypothetical protein